MKKHESSRILQQSSFLMTNSVIYGGGRVKKNCLLALAVNLFFDKGERLKPF